MNHEIFAGYPPADLGIGIAGGAVGYRARPAGKSWKPPHFSSSSIWEVAIKSSRGRADFLFDPQELRDELLNNGFIELAITSDHAIAVARLPPIHKDPFDRILIAQAKQEGITLLTSDSTLAQYPGPILLV